ncbi:MAG: nreB [Verrucomicrobia bacterium]|jgi:signal transduction histidine kinase|nr:nreB [Verrucomicrobiota bacterium]
MKGKLINFSQHYQAALRTHLQQGPRASLASAKGLGSRALGAGLQTLELAKLHERTLLADVLPAFPARQRPALIRQAGAFFAAAVIPIGKNNQPAPATVPPLYNKFIETLSQRTVELAASNLELVQEVSQRKTAEKALRKSEHHYAQLLNQSDVLQEQLRRLSRRVLSVQEDERRKISRELHDVIAQTLNGINIRLAALKAEATTNTQGLQDRISSTQRLVEHSVDIVHRFARELRPAVLDDLGLIPALHTFLINFKEETGIQVELSAAAAVEQLSNDKRTILFRVTQEAVTNVARHAHATRVEVKIEKREDVICLQIQDNGRGFPAERVLRSKKQKRLGLLGMRERVEMIHGTFTIHSTTAEGTTIQAEIPIADTRARRTKL